MMQVVDIHQELKSYPLFAPLDDSFIAKLSQLCTTQSFRSSETILAQGQLNLNIYILRQGSVEVRVDGEKVFELKDPGEVLGEMSVVSHRVASATVRTTSDVEVFVMNTEKVRSLPSQDQHELEFILHKIYSTVVTDRLAKTNDKARRFEIANRELQKTQFELQLINKGLENEIQKRTEEIRKKIRSISEDHLQPIQHELSQIVPGLSKNISGVVVKSIRSLTEVMDFLKPLAELQKNDKAMLSKKVLLVDPDKKQHSVARMALGGTGVDLDIAADLREADSFIQARQYDLIFCESSLSELINHLGEKGFKGQIVLITPLEIASYLDTLKALPQIHNVVSRDLEDRTFTVKNVAATVTKLLNKDYFGMEKYLAWGVQIHTQQVRHSNQRPYLIEEMISYFQKIGIRSSILSRCQVAAEEMLMNAIYDAPVDRDGKSLFNHLPRTTEVQLSMGQESVFRYASDGVLLAISVEDPFGSLSKDIIVKYLESCYQGNAGVFNKEKGGAGRGLHQLIESSDLTVFNVVKGVKTEVISILNIESALKKKDSRPTFHYFFN